MSEAEWLASTDPLRMPKQFRERPTTRKRCLLACAYSLYAPGGFAVDSARRVIEAVQATAMGAPPSKGCSDATAATVLRVVPDSAGLSRYNAWQWFRRPEYGTEGSRLGYFLSGCALSAPSNGDVNFAATTCLQFVRTAAQQEVSPVLNRIRNTHGGTVTDVSKEEVFALIPEPERSAARRAPWTTSWLPARVRNRVYAAAYRPRVAAASAAMAELVREVLGNPFRTSAIDPAWLVWNHGAVRHIAEQIVASGSFADMPILADALEDAGCADEHLLRHCREDRTHVPGCWALDAVLGK